MKSRKRSEKQELGQEVWVLLSTFWVCRAGFSDLLQISHLDGAARNLLQLSESSREVIEETLSSSLLWTSLHCGQKSPSHDSECFGFEQPTVRRAAWNLLLSVLQEREGESETRLSPDLR